MTAKSATALRTAKQVENSDVPLAPVAVAVITRPAGMGAGTTTEKLPFPVAFVTTVARPTNVSPSPLPELSHTALEKSSTVKVEEIVLFKVPVIVVPLVRVRAEVITGKFCILFAPVSPSPGSLGATPWASRSIPKFMLA